MKIWIDITNTPHVLFFDRMIRDMQRKHEVLITCRPLANTIEMLDAHDLPYMIVGRHYGAGKSGKALGFLIRCFQLWSFLRGKGVRASISHSSFYSPIVSWLLGIRCVYLNDNEHALGNVLSFPFASAVMTPEFLDRAKVLRQGCSRRKLIQYPGVKEGVYLWSFEPDTGGGCPAFDNGLKTVFIRPEPRTAQYYKGQKNFLDELVLALRGECNFLILPRDETQKKHYSQPQFSHIVIPATLVTLGDVARHCDLFIGAGGTMTREAAVLGVPTISVYQDSLLDVDRFLIAQGAMTHNANVTADDIRRILKESRRQAADAGILAKGRLAYELILDTLLPDRNEGKSDA